MSERTVIVGSDLHVKTVDEWRDAQEAKEAELHNSLDVETEPEESAEARRGPERAAL